MGKVAVVVKHLVLAALSAAGPPAFAVAAQEEFAPVARAERTPLLLLLILLMLLLLRVR
jgi:hypothetical protein